jgi:hypothetical protein
MKSIPIAALAILLSSSVVGQESEPAHIPDRQDYLEKSRNQKKAGWIMLGAGTLMAVVGGVIFNNTYDSDSYASTDIGGGLLLGGIVVDLASIPFFISSAKNARKAAEISFHYQNLLNIRGHSIVSKAYPAIMLKLPL